MWQYFKRENIFKKTEEKYREIMELQKRAPTFTKKKVDDHDKCIICKTG